MASPKDLKNVANDGNSQVNKNEVVYTSAEINEENPEYDGKKLGSCKDSKKTASVELDMENLQSHTVTSSNSEKCQATQGAAKRASFRPCVHYDHQNDVIEVIPDEAGCGVEDPDPEVPGCVYCERERQGQLQERGEEEESWDEEEEELESDDNRINYCEMFCDYMKEFVDSWYMVGILTALMLWAYSVVYAGNLCKNQCEFLGNIIDLFTLVGGTGFAASGTRIFVMVLQKLLKMNHFCVFLLVAAETFCFVWAYLVLLVFFILNGDEPTMVPGPAYCDLSFYRFMVASTWGMLAVLIILSVLYVSAYSSSLFKTSSEVNVVSSSRYGVTADDMPTEQ